MQNKERSKTRRPMIIFAGSHAIFDKLIMNKDLYNELRKDDSLNFGFRYCHRYCSDNNYFEKRDHYEKRDRQGTKESHFKKMHYY